MDGLTAAESRELESRMQKRQVKEVLGFFSNIVDHCFTACIDDFTSKTVSTRESGCITRCVQKTLATQQRLSERFQENNLEMMQQQQQR
ncbi:protein transporter tim9 [Sporothrix eucalyptigena]|uniref:Mitochondrial import inner membrane translocase subunit n=1 Tax=Sporothrix eucalyptigena TaxID=1812306 RepID=A0ABP0BY76_9PEZI